MSATTSDSERPVPSAEEQNAPDAETTSAGCPTSVWEALGWRLIEAPGGIPCLELPCLRQPGKTG